MLALLAATPTRLAALTADLAPAALQTRPTAEEWSLNELLAHLRAGADVWGRCMLTIFAEDTSTWRAVNPRTSIKQAN